MKKWQKSLILDLILEHLAQIWAPNFFASFTSTSISALLLAIILCNLKENQ